MVAEEVDEPQDLRQKRLFTGIYDRIPATVSGTSPTSISLGGGEREVWNFPNSVGANMMDVEHTFTLTYADPGAALGNWIFIVLIPIRQIVFIYNTQTLLNLTDAYLYTNCIAPAVITKDEFFAMDIGTGTTSSSGIIEGMRRSNNLFSGTTQTDFALRADNTNASINYDEFSYLQPSSALNSISPVLRYKYKFSKVFPFTIFTQSKDMWLDRNVSLTLVYEALTKVSFEGSSISDPTAGATTQTNTATFASSALLVPVQRNPEIVRQLEEEWREKGLEYVVDEPILQTETLAGTAQNPQITVPMGSAKFVKLVAWTLYNNTQGANTALDHSSLSTSKLTSFYSQTNGQRNESTLITLANVEAFAELKDVIPDSPIMQSSNMFKYNFIWLQSYGIKNVHELLQSDDWQGFDLESSSFSYNIFSTTASATHRWYIWAVLQKRLKLSPFGVEYGL